MGNQPGGCHCHNLSYVWNIATAIVQPRRCACSFCTKHGITWASHPDSALSIRIQEPDLLARYTFATGSCDFYVCRRCGTVPVGLAEIDGRKHAVVNINTLNSRIEIHNDVPKYSFDGETLSDRQNRRQTNWIRNVSVHWGKSGAGASDRHLPNQL